MPARTTQINENTEKGDKTESAGGGAPGPTVMGLLAACHPLPAAAVTLFTVALTAAAGSSLRGAALAVSAVATGQLSVGWCNDRADLRRDLATGRRDKPLAAGTASPAAVTRAAALALLLCVPLSLACGPLSRRRAPQPAWRPPGATTSG